MSLPSITCTSGMLDSPSNIDRGQCRAQQGTHCACSFHARRPRRARPTCEGTWRSLNEDEDEDDGSLFASDSDYDAEGGERRKAVKAARTSREATPHAAVAAATEGGEGIKEIEEEKEEIEEIEQIEEGDAEAAAAAAEVQEAMDEGGDGEPGELGDDLS